MSGYHSPPKGYKVVPVGGIIKPGYLFLLDGKWVEGTGILDHDCCTTSSWYANPVQDRCNDAVREAVASETMRCIEVIQDDADLSTEDKLRLIASILE